MQQTRNQKKKKGKKKKKKVNCYHKQKQRYV